MNQPTLPVTFGRYVLQQPIARGGMATVHAARFVAAEGVTRLVAAKRLHPQFTDDPEFVAMFHDEARIASQIHHPNVVPVLDVILDGEEVILVQEYVHGVPLSHLFKLALATNTPVPKPIVITIIAGVLAGLHAAHEATDDVGEPLGVVHRDVSPQNVIVSVDGIPRLVDFGIAKARTSIHHTREGFFKGKLAYMAPEQFRAEPVTRTADVYAAGVLLWELIVNRRFYDGKNDVDFVRAVALGSIPTPTEALEAERDSISDERWADVILFESIVRRAISTASEERYETAMEMATALLDAGQSATAADVAAWVRAAGADYLEKRQQILSSTDDSWRTNHRGNARLFEPTSARSLDDVRGSGARMKLTLSDGSAESESRGAAEPTSGTASSQLHSVETRSIAPWTVVAALLVIVGVLVGIVIVRDPTSAFREAPAAAARPIATATVPAVTHSVAPEPEAPASEASVAAPPAARPQPPSTAARFIAPVKVQQAPPPRAAPAPIPTPTPVAPSARADCNPPFYFDGNKKIFKPSCL